MKLDLRYCVPCSFRQVVRNGRASGASEEEITEAIKETAKFLIQDLDITPAEVATFFNRRFKEKHPIKDPYKEIRFAHNKEVLEVLPLIEKKMNELDNPLQFALKVSAIGNSIDMGIFENIDINELLKEIENKNIAIDHSDDILKRTESKRNRILLIADNSGEIAFDLLFVKYASLRGHDIYVSVKGGPILNDAIIYDAIQVGMDKYANIITTGVDELGVIMKNVSEEFRQIFDTADIVISKGHANFETLYGNEREIFYILKTKCKPVADYCGTEVGDIIIKRIEGEE